jgi:hypothetical protein
VVLVGGDDDSRFGTEVEVPELVAGGEGSEEELFGVPAGFVAAEGGVGGT